MKKKKKKRKRKDKQKRVDNLKFCPYNQKSLIAYILLNLLTEMEQAHVRRFDNRV